MTVVGQTQVSYGWDNANRLTGITQGSTSIGFGYDTANRRSTLTLPNGIVLTYTYDNNSRVTAMNWNLGSTAVGDLEYQYDPDGRVIAEDRQPRTGPAAHCRRRQHFNAANEMATFNGTTLAYDANGNLTNNGTHGYSLGCTESSVGMTGSSTASFVYDGLGRRTSKTVSGNTTQFVYDRLNPVQEIQGGVPSANLLTGRRIDEYFQRTDSAGARRLSDAIFSAALSP